MDVVKAFNSELASLYESKPPVSKARMVSITKAAMKAIKYYKHVVLSVEKFIQKCKLEYKIPGLYVIDSIVRQSRHQFGGGKDVFGPRFAKNFELTIRALLECSEEDKKRVVRVLKLWLANDVFTHDVIDPLLRIAEQYGVETDMPMRNEAAKPKPPTAKEVPQTYIPSKPQQNHSNVGRNEVGTPKENISRLDQSQPLEHGAGSDKPLNPAFLQQIQQLTSTLISAQQTKKDKKIKHLLSDGFDYSDESGEDISDKEVDENEDHNAVVSAAGELLNNPEILQQIQMMQDEKKASLYQEPDRDMSANIPMEPLNTYDTAMGNNRAGQPDFSMPPPGIGGGSGGGGQMDLSVPPPGVFGQHGSNQNKPQQQLHGGPTPNFHLPPPNFNVPPPPVPPGFEPHPPAPYPSNMQNSLAFGGPPAEPTPPNLWGERRDSYDQDLRHQDRGDSDDRRRKRDRDDRDEKHKKSSKRKHRSRSRSRERSHKHKRRSRSKGKDRDRDDGENGADRDDKDRKKKRSKRSRSPEDPRDKERDRERRKAGLPSLKPNIASVCSRTVWFGSVPQYCQEDDIRAALIEAGQPEKIELVPPRGCAYVLMPDRKAAYKIIHKLRNVLVKQKSVKVSWSQGRGTKTDEFKQYWDSEKGATFIPWEKLPEDLNTLMEGNFLDLESLPEELKGKYKEMVKEEQRGASPGIGDMSAESKPAEDPNQSSSQLQPPQQQPQTPQQMPMPGFGMPPPGGQFPYPPPFMMPPPMMGGRMPVPAPMQHPGVPPQLPPPHIVPPDGPPPPHHVFSPRGVPPGPPGFRGRGGGFDPQFRGRGAMRGMDRGGFRGRGRGGGNFEPLWAGRGRGNFRGGFGGGGAGRNWNEGEDGDEQHRSFDGTTDNPLKTPLLGPPSFSGDSGEQMINDSPLPGHTQPWNGPPSMGGPWRGRGGPPPGRGLMRGAPFTPRGGGPPRDPNSSGSGTEERRRQPKPSRWGHFPPEEPSEESQQNSGNDEDGAEAGGSQDSEDPDAAAMAAMGLPSGFGFGSSGKAADPASWISRDDRVNGEENREGGEEGNFDQGQSNGEETSSGLVNTADENTGADQADMED